MQARCSAPFRTTVCTWFFMLTSAFKRARSSPKSCTLLYLGRSFLDGTFWPRLDFKSVSRILLADELFLTLQHLSKNCDVASILLIDHYFHAKCSKELNSLLLLGLTFTTMTHYATYIVTNHPNCICISQVRIPLEELLFANRRSVELNLKKMFPCSLQ